MTDALFAALRTWILATCPDLTDVVQEQTGIADAPRRPLPYAAIFARSDVGLAGTTHRATTNTPGTVDAEKVQQKHKMPRRMTLVVDLFGDGSLERAQALEVSPNLDTIQQQFHTAKIAVSYAGGIGDTTKLRSTAWEQAVQVEFYVTKTHETTVEVPYIETTVFDLTYNAEA